tara:strand:+ start:547 stop:780 length:234 start_codon:yes stop_codon:yes gene_type:complete
MYLINPSFLKLAKKKLNIKEGNITIDQKILKLRNKSSCQLIETLWREYPGMKSLTVAQCQDMGWITSQLQCYKFLGK